MVKTIQEYRSAAFLLTLDDLEKLNSLNATNCLKLYSMSPLNL